MPRKIRIGDEWYVAATEGDADGPPQVLKDGRTFAMFDRHGDIQARGPGHEGVYQDDTRYLSHQELTIDGVRPLYLGGSIEDGNNLLAIDLMNPDLGGNGGAALTRGTLHIFRAKLLWQGACHEHLRLVHHGREPVQVRLELHFAADFADLFELRGMVRQQRGEPLPPRLGPDEVTLACRGLDGLLRSTRLRFEPAPDGLAEDRARFDVLLEPGREHHLYCTVTCEQDGQSAPAQDYGDAVRASHACRARVRAARCAVETSNPLVNLWLDRSAADVAMLTTELPTGPYPFAGVPWYSTTFGRDGILTALQYLWLDPSLGRGVLSFLAATQADGFDPARDAEPGKVLHEARQGEMANTGEIPFGRYYGTVDATPLFVVLAAAWYQRTGDADFLRQIWPHVLRALAWIDTHGDADGDGFVEYDRRSAEGLVQQGWKDSQDSVFHAGGELARAPIALCEVQGYVYQGKQAIARVARDLGDEALGQRLEDEARALAERFRQAFWCEDLGTYAIALDAGKQPCKVRASNAGHTLWSGIASQAHADRIIQDLCADGFFSGWGIRTIAAGQARYNPMSYHNGSIWPHDNALIAAGMARHGRTDAAVRLFVSLFEASLHFDSHRLPELFCGFPRRAGAGPTLYPVACAPQAWAAASAFGLLQACLGLEVDAVRGRIVLRSPQLPPAIDWLHLRGLGAPGASADLLLQRHEHSVGVQVVRKDAGMSVTTMA